MSEKTPRCPRLFDYSLGADNADFNKDIEETNKISVEEMKNIAKQVVLWRLKKAYYSEQELENFAKTINVPPVRVECATKVVLTFLRVYFAKKLEKRTLSAELEKGGMSPKLIEAVFETIDKYSAELDKSYKSPAAYGAGFSGLSWRIDLKLEDTKRHTAPEYRILFDLRIEIPGKDEKEHVFFELEENDIFMLTSCLSDIVAELGKLKKSTTV